MIEVKQIGDGDPLEFEVMVREASGESRHHLTMSKETYERVIAERYTPEGWLDAAFRFLLDSRAQGVDSWPVRRHRDLPILSGVRARAATLPFTIIIFAKLVE